MEVTYGNDRQKLNRKLSSNRLVCHIVVKPLNWVEQEGRVSHLVVVVLRELPLNHPCNLIMIPFCDIYWVQLIPNSQLAMVCVPWILTFLSVKTRFRELPSFYILTFRPSLTARVRCPQRREKITAPLLSSETNNYYYFCVKFYIYFFLLKIKKCSRS